MTRTNTKLLCFELTHAHVKAFLFISLWSVHWHINAAPSQWSPTSCCFRCPRFSRFSVCYYSILSRSFLRWYAGWNNIQWFRTRIYPGVSKVISAHVILKLFSPDTITAPIKCSSLALLIELNYVFEFEWVRIDSNRIRTQLGSPRPFQWFEICNSCNDVSVFSCYRFYAFWTNDATVINVGTLPQRLKYKHLTAYRNRQILTIRWKINERKGNFEPFVSRKGSFMCYMIICGGSFHSYRASNISFHRSPAPNYRSWLQCTHPFGMQKWHNGLAGRFPRQQTGISLARRSILWCEMHRENHGLDIRIPR